MTTLDRRAVLVGACGTCAVVVTGCAAYGPAQPAPAPAPAPAQPGAGAADAKLAATADVPVGGGVILADAQLVITQPKAGTFKAFSATCTHKSCLVGDVRDGMIVCTCHGSEFSITDGSVVAAPRGLTTAQVQPLPEKTVTVSGDQISVG